MLSRGLIPAKAPAEKSHKLAFDTVKYGPLPLVLTVRICMRKAIHPRLSVRHRRSNNWGARASRERTEARVPEVPDLREIQRHHVHA